MNRNLFATVLTYAAPSSNYRGESEENRTVMQKINKGGRDYSIISPESMRNALREILAKSNPEWCNRSRLHNEEQLAVEFKEFPNADKFADDFLFGYMVADKEAIKNNKDKPAKRDSLFRMNLAVALTPYRFNAIFHQSPLNAGNSPWKNSSSSALIYREVAHTAYQYPFALSQRDCQLQPAWTKALIKAVSELNGVAGGHARSYYEMSPASIVARLTPSLVAGYDTYGFDEKGEFVELERINKNDLPGSEFWLGGEIVRKIQAEERIRLETEKVKLYENPQQMLADLAEAFLK
ncbi:MAG: type I-B CRISPR-associated protein Cas7/Cst2/DevR [Acidobacteria bacterium]|nr:type I-B CRISPR-associated protein Cas7/Cst2/DevR [Acidobacteriota bacterium]